MEQTFPQHVDLPPLHWVKRCTEKNQARSLMTSTHASVRCSILVFTDIRSITWPGAGRCRPTIADVDEPSKKRQLFIFGVPCVRLLSDDEDWDSDSRRRSSTQGVAKQPCSHHVFVETQENLKTLVFDQSWADAVTVLSSVQEDVMRPWPRHFTCMSLTWVCFVPAAWSGASAKTPRNFQAFFLKWRERTTYQNSLRCN